MFRLIAAAVLLLSPWCAVEGQTEIDFRPLTLEEAMLCNPASAFFLRDFDMKSTRAFATLLLRTFQRVSR